MGDQNWTEHTRGWYPLQDQFDSVPYHFHVMIGSFMMVILFLAVGGNTLVIAVFMGSRKLRTPSNMLVLNLAAADLLMALCVFPLIIVSCFYGGWVYEPWVCDFMGATVTVFGLMSINTLVFISLDRYVVIVGPKHIPRATSKNMRYCILAIWMYSLFWGIIPIFGWNRYIRVGYGTTCSIDYFTREGPHNQFLLCMMLFDYLIPCSLIVVIYILIFCTVKQRSVNFRPMISNRDTVKDGSRRRNSTMLYKSAADHCTLKSKRRFKLTQLEYKIARTMLVVVLLYCMAWTPYAAVALIGQYGFVKVITPTISMLPSVFAKVSTVYNPIVYALTHPRFKLELLKILNAILPVSVLDHNPLSWETSSRVSGSMSESRSRRTSSLTDSSAARSRRTSSLTDCPAATAKRPSGTPTTINISETTKVIAEVNRSIDDEGIEETPTTSREAPEHSPEGEHYLMNVVMSQDHKHLHQDRFMPQVNQTESNCFHENNNQSLGIDISGEMFYCVDIEAIRLEGTN